MSANVYPILLTNPRRQLVTNHFLHFLALDRSDQKKFQVLQLISALLGWNEEQKEAAGLARPGAATASNLRVPLSQPFRRVSSTAAMSPISGNFAASSSSTSHLGASDAGLTSPKNQEGLAELWSEFLEREASGDTRSRRGSTRSSVGTGTPTGRGGMMSPTSTMASPGTNVSKQRLDEVDEGPAPDTKTPQ